MKIISKMKSGDGMEIYVDDLGRIISESDVKEMATDAAINGDIDKISELLIAGYDVNTLYEDDYTLLEIASLNNYSELIKFLLRVGANPNLPPAIDYSPLMYAVMHGNADTLTTLLANGAYVNYVSKFNFNALRVAVKFARLDYLDMVELLLQPKYKLDRECAVNVKTLSALAQFCHREIVNYIAGSGLKTTDMVCKTGLTLDGAQCDLMLNIAAEHGYLELAKLFLEMRAENAYISEKSVFIAISKGHLDIVYLILHARSDKGWDYSYETWHDVIDQRNYFAMRLLMKFSTCKTIMSEAPNFLLSERGRERAKYLADCFKKIIDENESSQMIMNELRLDHTSRFFGVPLDILKFHLHPMIRHPSLPSINSAISRVDISNVAVEDNESFTIADKANESSPADAALEPSMRPRG